LREYKIQTVIATIVHRRERNTEGLFYRKCIVTQRNRMYVKN